MMPSRNEGLLVIFVTSLHTTEVFLLPTFLMEQQYLPCPFHMLPQHCTGGINTRFRVHVYVQPCVRDILHHIQHQSCRLLDLFVQIQHFPLQSLGHIQHAVHVLHL